MSKVFFIAEVGKNFIDFNWMDSNPFLKVYDCTEKAKLLVNAAKKAGADAVKFQTHVFEDEQYIRSDSRYKWIKFNENVTDYMSFWLNLKNYCDEIEIEFMTTPMSKMAAQKVNNLVKRWKVGSGNVTDVPLLEYIASTNKAVILSTGMSTEKQVLVAIDILKNNPLTLMYCKSIYPCPMDKIVLKKIQMMEARFNYPVGFSDHTKEITTPMFALAWGAKVVEKHFTLDKNAVGPDHHFSLDPDELALSIKLVREYGEISSALIYPLEEEVKLWKDFRTNEKNI